MSSRPTLAEATATTARAQTPNEHRGRAILHARSAIAVCPPRRTRHVAEALRAGQPSCERRQLAFVHARRAPVPARRRTRGGGAPCTPVLDPNGASAT